MAYRELLHTALEVVNDAEALFRDGVGACPSVHKGPRDFATSVDLEIERLIRARLTAETGIEVFGEEHGGFFDQAKMWVVDPIDGTSNYAVGNPMCAILLSLVVESEPVVAVTSHPLLGRRITWAQGQEAKFNEQPVHSIGNRPAALGQLGVSSAVSGSLPPTHRAAAGDLLCQLAHGPFRPRITGSVGTDLAFVAQGVFDGAISLSPHVWDNAAGVALARAAGAVVTDLSGNPWTPQSHGVIAGAPEAHTFLLSTIKQTKSSSSSTF
ncbi:inositol monophosphatase family protein [Corynebacterium tapiri]|uniref:inositol-phosphate phosphatase n=1 Tax=Corynebacterium tapiri TaxID=1448266 RepID=A0A5C4U781_9CORY|nr:inositol monophosphatase family protein [Corynebacterium tapiri]TNL99351.1 inositol monophosphatase family protein [Corynebacterium tapiri]